MAHVLKTLEQETKGRCFGTRKYCVDNAQNSIITYDEYPKIIYKEQGETEKHKTYVNLKERADSIVKLDPLLKFFMDGSRRTYKVDDIVYGDKVFPIIGGQIGVGCCRRENRKMHAQELQRELVLALPSRANKDGDNDELFFNSVIKKINETAFLRAKGLSLARILFYHDKKDDDYEKIGIGKIQDRMIELEKKLVVQLVEKRLLHSGAYLLKDGSLEYKTTKSDDVYKFDRIRNNYRWVVGVSKSFNPSLAQTISGKSSAKNIADLPKFHRTPVFMYKPEISAGEKFAVWYVRIRDGRYNISPFDGVLKVEKVLISPNEQEYGLSSDEVDNISANLINERNPVCYGNDTRWANHIYPVFLTESFVKSKYLSNEFFLNLF